MGLVIEIEAVNNSRMDIPGFNELQHSRVLSLIRMLERTLNLPKNGIGN